MERAQRASHSQGQAAKENESMTIKLPALIPDRNSASGFRVEYLSCEIDPELAAQLSEEPSREAKRMLRLAHEIQGAALERLGQLTWSDKDLIIKALHTAAELSPQDEK
jgi:hypothetical protein